MEQTHESWIKGSNIADVFQCVGRRMLAQPKFHESHENSITCQKRSIQ